MNISEIPISDIVGRSINFKISSYRDLDIFSRSTVVKGSTFNIMWRLSNAPSLMIPLVMRRKIDGLTNKYIDSNGKRRLATENKNLNWQTAQGIPCVPFQWKNRMHFECTSGALPRELNGK